MSGAGRLICGAVFLFGFVWRNTMKGVWFSLVALALGVAGVMSVVPTIADAAGLTRAGVLAAIAGHDLPGTAPFAASGDSGGTGAVK
jgi:hypothetical protein